MRQQRRQLQAVFVRAAERVGTRASPHERRRQADRRPSWRLPDSWLRCPRCVSYRQRSVANIARQGSGCAQCDRSASGVSEFEHAVGESLHVMIGDLQP
jgi:hypothetical protein